MPGPGEEVSWRAGEEEVSSGPGQAGRDNPASRRAPPDRVASGRTGAAGRVCKRVRMDRRAGRRVWDNVPEPAGAATSPRSAQPLVPGTGLRPELSPSAVRQAGSNSPATSSAAAAVVFNGAAAVSNGAVAAAFSAPAAAVVFNAVAAVVASTVAGERVAEAGVADGDILASR